MKTDRLGTILFLVVMFSIASSLPGYALEPPPTLETALAGTVPIVFSPGLLIFPVSKQYLFPGGTYHTVNSAPKFGFRGVITRMTAFHRGYAVSTKYTLYVNGKPTNLTCIEAFAMTPYQIGNTPINNSTDGCSVNWNVPIDVNDQVCVELQYGGGGQISPTITLMVRMGGK